MAWQIFNIRSFTRRRLAVAAICLTLSSGAFALDSRQYIERSVVLIESGSFELARTYLAPALIDYRLSASERSRAYYLRGYSYYAQSLFVSAHKDYARALEFNPENPAAQLAMGGLYYRGEGVAADATLAFGFFEESARSGHAQAQFFIGLAYLDGNGAQQNLTLARQWLEDAAEQGLVSAMSHLGRSYRKPFLDTLTSSAASEEEKIAQPETAKQWYERAYATGATNALVALAYMWQRGEFGDPDIDAAIQTFTQAADEGSPSAKVALGHAYLTGSGVEKDLLKARQLLELAAAEGDLTGAASLGHLYERGLGVAQSEEMALQWYERGAQAGDANAQLRLFYLLISAGHESEAAPWIARAAEQGIAQGQNDYAWLLSTSQEQALRDGDVALDFAQRAVAQSPSPAYLDTLAAAYAESGNYPDAIDTQQQALALIDEVDSEEAKALRDHLVVYQSGKPWRE